MKIVLGKIGNRNITMDLDVLMRTRLLVQADSGGGKSWLLRRLAEQMFGKIQVILIDPEGEFATLREKYGYVLVGKGGETPADPRSAALVAHKLLELHASAVCDIYELKHHARHQWVRLFLEAMIEAPKNLWRPCIVIVDEAHVYCPEKGKGESEASGAMSDLCTRGRKRGFCAIFATQRLGQLSKDASSQLQNRLIGPTFEDINRKRAADVLGILKSDERAFFKEIQLLEPGKFYALGRAISRERILVDVADVETTHPEAGSTIHAAKPPPPPEKVRGLLPKLKDLPQMAEEQAKTVAELKHELSVVRAENAGLKRVAPVVAAPPKHDKIPAVKIKALSEAQIKRVETTVCRLHKVSEKTLEAIQAIAGAVARSKSPSIPQVPKKAVPIFQKPPARPVAESSVRNGTPGLLAGQRRMLETLARRNPLRLTRTQLGTLCGLTASAGTFGNYFGTLRREGLVEYRNGEVSITEAGLLTAGVDAMNPQTQAEVLEMWRNNLLAGERRMLDVLIELHPGCISKEELGVKVGIVHTGGTFGNYLGTLKRNGLAESDGQMLKAGSALFL